MLHTILRQWAAAVAILLALPAHAGLVAMDFTGSVFGYFSLGILADDFPTGTPVSMSLRYDDSFIGLPSGQLFLGMAPAISGSMTLGGKHYQITGMTLSFYSYGATTDDPSPNYGFHVTGTGPATDEDEVFSGIGLLFTSGLPLGRPYLIGFGNTNWHVADNGYLQISGDTTYERIATPVPLPGTLWLIGIGLCALGLRRRVPSAASTACRPSTIG